MLNLEKSLMLNENSRIRKDLDGATLFYRKSLNVQKTTDFVFEILKHICNNNYSVKQLIAEFDIKKNNVDTFVTFLSGLFESGCIEYNKERKLNYKQIIDLQDNNLPFQAPNMVWWDITAACNLNCYYCYSAAGKPAIDELSTDEIYDILKQLSDMGVFFVFYLGGEPFIKKDFFAILEKTYELGLGIMIATNGTLITKDIAKKLDIVSNIRISLDSGNEKIHNLMRGDDSSYGACLSALEILSGVGIPYIGINCTVGLENYKDIESVFDIALQYGCNQIQFIPVSGSGRALENNKFLQQNERDILINQLKKIQTRIDNEGLNIIIDAPEGYIEKPHLAKALQSNNNKLDVMGCSAGKLSLAIFQNGDVAFCIMYRKVITSLRNDSAKNIWQEVSQYIKINKNKNCMECTNEKICSGPCMIESIDCDNCDKNALMKNFSKKEKKNG